MLVLSIEALIQQRPRSAEAVELVNRLVAETEKSKLVDSERNSLLGSLRHLSDESIGQAGKRLVAERLGNRIYADRTAPKFFNHVYQARSVLVHGKLPYPTIDQINMLAAVLSDFVSDLLTVPILGPREFS